MSLACRRAEVVEIGGGTDVFRRQGLGQHGQRGEAIRVLRRCATGERGHCREDGAASTSPGWSSSSFCRGSEEVERERDGQWP